MKAANLILAEAATMTTDAESEELGDGVDPRQLPPWSRIGETTVKMNSGVTAALADIFQK